MLFLITHSHSAERCPVNEGKEALEKHYRSLQADVGRRLGIEVLGLFTATIQHANFIILKSDKFENLRDYLEPLYTRGTVEIYPIVSFAQRVHELDEGREPPPTDYYCMTCRLNFFESDMDIHKGHRYYNQKEMEEIWPHELGGEAGSG